ncbi:MAG TPA: NB-ARC domain-containing protein, partial [Abditibacteriaceae bacterium]
THAFPPLNTLDPLRHNLPVPVGPHIGRDDEISAWRALICPPGNDEMSRTGARLLTLTGMGGLGKTRAALQLAELCIGNFADGVWWIALDEVRDGEAVFDRIAAALRLSLSANSSVREQVIAYLRERQILLVLDNTEQISDAPDAVTHLLNATERLRLLVTSRRALQLYAECVREVRPLASSEAIRLFAERACALRPFELTQHNEADVLELCRRLEGVPLAIELAASRIGVASPREMLRHLNERFRLLQTRAPDLPPRQRALRGAFDWSYELLTPDNQTVFAQLAVFAGGFFTEGAMAVCDSFEALDGVAELRSQSLLRSRADAATQQTRFSMLESVREYALEKLGASGPLAQETRERHAAYFERQAFEWRQALRARRNETATLAAMDADADNVRSAFEWVCHHGSADAKASLGLSLGVYCRLRGRAQEANDAVEAGLKAVESSGSLSEAELHRERASLCLDRFETDAARACAETALELFSSQNALSGVAETENLLGLISNQQGELTSARRNLSSALAHFKAEGDDVGVAKARNNLALIELSALAAGDTSTDLEAAAGHLQAALALHRKNDDRRGLAETLTNLGVLAQETGEFSVAWRYYLDALAVECELDFTLGIARTLYNLGEVAEVRGDNSAATRLARSAAWFFHEIGSPLERYAVTLAERTTGHLTHEEKQQVDAGANFSSLPRNDILKWALGDSETLAPSLIPSSALRP